MKEVVLVVKDEDVQKAVRGYNFVDVPMETMRSLVERNGFFVERERAEHDETIRQLIPYVVMRNREDRYLLVKRLKKQTEKRLHGFYSVGIGGHVNDQDEGNDPWMKFLAGMEREISEEVVVKGPFENSPKYIGVIRENTTPVNRVHIGLIFEVKADIEGIREVDKFSWEFTDMNGLMERYEEMETWSQVAVDAVKR